MLFKLSEHISNCIKLAALAERRAEETTDPGVRSDNEKLAHSWRHLAASYQFVESLERFLADKDPNNTNIPSPPDLPSIANEQPASGESTPISPRRPVKHTISFRDRLFKLAQESRDKAAQLPAGRERDHLLRKAQQSETAAAIERWVSSPGSRPPAELNGVGKKPKR